MNKKYLIVFVAAFAACMSGCGKDRKGTYTGGEDVTLQGGGASQHYNVTYTVNSTDNNTMSGNYASSAGTGTLTGTISGDGNTLINVSLSMPQQNSGATVNGMPVTGCGGSYTGTLKLDGNTITGNLNLQSPVQAVPQPYPTPNAQYPNGYAPNSYPNGYNPYSSSTCVGGTRTINISKQ
jgi:hypothetical protein